MNPQNEADLEFDAATFCGRARLFPLPNLVLYPHVMQPLHIFEERYREMMEDALAGDRLIAMALLKPGWEIDYESRPPISRYACLGKIVAHNRLTDGRYNLLLLGVQRIRICQELAPLRAFRQAEVALVDDCYECATCHQLKSLTHSLLAAFRKRLPCSCEVPEQIEEMLSQNLSLGAMTDLAAYTLPLDGAVKERLLGEMRVVKRAQMLIAEVRKLARDASSKQFESVFPPRFSSN